MSEISNVATMTLDGGNPALDFVNSGYDREPGKIAERLHDYGDLLTLSSRLGLMDQEMFGTLKLEAEVHPKHAASVLVKAKKLRKALYDIVNVGSALQRGGLGEEAVRVFNEYLGEALKYKEVATDGTRFTQGWRVDKLDLEYPLRRIIA